MCLLSPKLSDRKFRWCFVSTDLLLCTAKPKPSGGAAMYNGGAGSCAPAHSPAPVDAFDADEHDEFEWFNAGTCGLAY